MMSVQPQQESQREDFYERIGEHHYGALWQVLHSLITPQPKSPVAVHKWDYTQARKFLLEAGGLITAEEAERRVLVLENPGMRGESRITTSLYAGLQLVLPGEIAPCHRHTQSALRFVIEGSGASTSVDGEKTLMEVGDFVITPPWAWHDHGNDSTEPMIWMDGLDVPMVALYDASFAQGLSANRERMVQDITRNTGDSWARYGANMLPVDFEQHKLASPIFNYPYARSREALEMMRQQQEWDPCHGLKMRYINPVDGSAAMPTISPFLQLLPKGFRTEVYRSTDATVFTPVEGSGKTWVGETCIEWQAKDIFVVPSWTPVVHEASEDAVLFSFSDRIAQQKLGLWREHRGPEQESKV
jgi:gentisate 1,2-dioxygenase